MTIKIKCHKTLLHPYKMLHQTKVQEQSISEYSKNTSGYSTTLRHDFQNRKYSSEKVAFKIQKACIDRSQGIHPRIFCRRWFGLEAINQDGRARFTQGQILAMESEHGYREKCINLLARILQIKPNTIHRWGKGVDFDKIPADKRQKYQIYLGYVDAIRIMTSSLTEELDEHSLLRVLRRLEMR